MSSTIRVGVNGLLLISDQKEVFAQSKEFKRIGDLSQVVLNLFGAMPFDEETAPVNE